MKLNELTKKEKSVIENKGTERPLSGEYNDLFEEGIYLCRRCNAPLYEAKTKFKSDCGWPSFDEEIKGAVTRKKDADGERVEIICSNCGAHLGHVFEGENYTPKNIRHCVNSISMRFIPKKFKEGEENFIVLGAGCFWCSEAVFKELKGVISVIPGYGGGQTLDPNYEKVSKDNTGHAEVVKIAYDPKIISFSDLLQVFFSTHDPTTPNRQGNDIGEQYRSIILYKTLEQKESAEKMIEKLNKEKVYRNPIVTEISPLTEFYPAESEHGNYFEKHKGNPYCQLVINPKLTAFRKKFQKLLK